MPFFGKIVVFSDETMMKLNNERSHCVRRPKIRDLSPNFCVILEWFFTENLIIWGSIRSNRDGLRILIGNKLNSDAYTEILKDYAISFFFVREPLQQDNAPAHISLKIFFLWQKNFTLLENSHIKLLI